jgi:hypothetical protein
MVLSSNLKYSWSYREGDFIGSISNLKVGNTKFHFTQNKVKWRYIGLPSIGRLNCDVNSDMCCSTIAIAAI